MRPTIAPGTVCVLNSDGDLGIYGELRPFFGTRVRVVRVQKGGEIELETLEGVKLPMAVPYRNLRARPVGVGNNYAGEPGD